MANFRYVAKSMDGKTVRGTMEASGESSLLQQLKEQGLFLVEAKDKDNTKKYKKFMSAQLAGLCRGPKSKHSRITLFTSSSTTMDSL